MKWKNSLDGLRILSLFVPLVLLCLCLSIFCWVVVYAVIVLKIIIGIVIFKWVAIEDLVNEYNKNKNIINKQMHDNINLIF